MLTTCHLNSVLRRGQVRRKSAQLCGGPPDLSVNGENRRGREAEWVLRRSSWIEAPGEASLLVSTAGPLRNHDNQSGVLQPPGYASSHGRDCRSPSSARRDLSRMLFRSAEITRHARRPLIPNAACKRQSRPPPASSPASACEIPTCAGCTSARSYRPPFYPCRLRLMMRLVWPPAQTDTS